MEPQAKIDLKDAYNIADLLDNAETLYAALAEGLTISAPETAITGLKTKASGMRMMAKYLRLLQSEDSDELE